MARTYLQPHYGNGFSAMFIFKWTTLRGKHCRHPIAVMGVVDTFGHCCVNLNQPCINEHFEGFVGKKLSFHGSTES